MVVRRRSARKSKKVVHKRRASTIKAKVKDPGYMVQVNEPSLLRRDLLETLREVILFMQSYEKFKRVQQDKVHLFTSLKTDLKELNMLLGTKMKAHFPQGKLDAITEADEHNRIEKQHELEEGEIRSERISMARQAPAPRRLPAASSAPEPKHELDQLEDQLRDIESQLKNIQ